MTRNPKSKETSPEEDNTKEWVEFYKGHGQDMPWPEVPLCHRDMLVAVALGDAVVGAGEDNLLFRWTRPPRERKAHYFDQGAWPRLKQRFEPKVTGRPLSNLLRKRGEAPTVEDILWAPRQNEEP